MKWSQSEIETLNKYYSISGYTYCSNLLNRTENSIIHKANRLGLISKNIWSDDDIYFLETHYNDFGAVFCSEKLNRSRDSVVHKAKKLGLKNKSKKSWNNDEIYFLESHYSDFGASYCSEKLKRSINSIKNKARTLGLEVNENTKNKLKSEKLKEQPKDGLVKRNLLEKVKIDLYNINDIMMSVIEWNISYRKRENRLEQMKYSLNNRLLSEYFSSYNFNDKSNVSPNKLLSNISEKNKKYFYLGLSDADGCFYYNNKGTYQYFVSSSYNQDWKHMETIFNFLNIRYIVVKRKQKRKDGNYDYSSIIRISNKNDIIKYGEYIYSGNDVGVDTELANFKPILLDDIIIKTREKISNF
jgi:hypothetical protein